MWTERLPVGVVNLLWALAALRWKRGKWGATYASLHRMTGTSHHSALRRVVVKAEATGLVKVRPYKKTRAVCITPAALKLLEATWTRSK